MSQTAAKQLHRRAAVIAIAAAALACVVGLFLTRPPFRTESGFTLLLGKHAEYLPFVPLFVLAVLLKGERVLTPLRDLGARITAWLSLRDPYALSIFIGNAVLAFAASANLANQFEVVTPTYHDEFSYLFQAQTFLSGEVAAPGFPDAPHLFDQMHVLSRDRMASRYFPGTGLWLAPFVSAGDPWLGPQVAHAVCAVLITFCGLLLQGRTTALVAGLLFGLSPGLLLFSNLLLAHHPTMVGLLTFLAAYLKWMRTRSPLLLIVASAGLTYAMLCRPMTAAGFALPFGIHFAAYLLRPTEPAPTFKQRWVALGCMAGPILLGFVALATFNAAITGNWKVTPYQEYTDQHTPRHVYGFANGAHGDDAVQAPEFDKSRRMVAYDEWATNLTLPVAIANVGKRLESSSRLTLSVLLIALVATFIVVTWRTQSTAVRLLGWSIVSLHVAHVPYWFSGIMHWHYVLESSICWVLLTGLTTHQLVTTALAASRDRLALLWPATIALAVVLNVTSYLPWYVAEILGGASEIDFARTQYDRFFRSAEQIAGDSPAVVLVRPDESTPQIDYVVNEPGLDAQILYARVRPSDSLPQVIALFPDRNAFLFDAASKQFQAIRPAIR